MLILIRLVQACVFATFGKIYATWFMKTTAGIWLMVRVEAFMEYLAVKYDFELAKKEAKWVRDYPNLAKRLEEYEYRLVDLETTKSDKKYQVK